MLGNCGAQLHSPKYKAPLSYKRFMLMNKFINQGQNVVHQLVERYFNTDRTIPTEKHLFSAWLWHVH